MIDDTYFAGVTVDKVPKILKLYQKNGKSGQWTR